MYIIKFRILHKGCIFSERVKKFGVENFTYALGWYKKGKLNYFKSVSMLRGDEDKKKKFLKDLRKDKRLKKLEIVGNMYFVLYADSPSKGFYTPAYDPALIFPVPVFQKGAFEYWEVATWEKKILIDLIEQIRLHKDIVPEFEILKLKKTKLDEIFIPQLMPKLSPMQKHVFEFAVSRGYYNFPRKSSLKKLAKILNVSVPTALEHLRKAESKILPYTGNKK